MEWALCERNHRELGRRWKAVFLPPVSFCPHYLPEESRPFCPVVQDQWRALPGAALILAPSHMQWDEEWPWGAKNQLCVCAGGALWRDLSALHEVEQDCLMSQLFYSVRIIQRRRREKINRCGGEKTCCRGQGLWKKRAGSLPTCPCQTSACWGAAPCPALQVLHLTHLFLPCPQSVALKPEEPCFTAFFSSLILQAWGHIYSFSLAARH